MRVVVAAVAFSLWAMTFSVWSKAPIPCGDFVQQYTMGSLVHEPSRIYDVDRYHAAQTALVPASATLFYAPVYPPQLALVAAPFSRLPFGLAVVAWSALMIGLYVLILRSTYRSLNLRVDPAIFLLSAFAFPPFVEMVQYGQTTVLLLGACFLAWRALEREQSLLAGAALGLLALKPQLTLPFVIIVLAGREWRMLAGAACAVVLQAVVVWLLMGAGALTGFWTILPDIVANASALEPVAERVHSLRSWTNLLPQALATPVWITAVTVILGSVGVVWRTSAPARVRLGFAILAGVLVSPHLIEYDLTLLVLPLLWLGDWNEHRNATGRAYASAIAVLFVTLAVPWAAIVRVQPSVVVMLWIGYRVCSSLRPSSQRPVTGFQPSANTACC